MGKTVISWITLTALLMTLLSGCVMPVETEVTQPPAPTTTYEEIVLDTLPPLIQINGKMYQKISSLDADIQVDEALIEGYSTVCNPITRYPEKDGESNFAPEGSPYAKWSTEEHPDAYVIRYTWKLVTAWYLLIPTDEVG